MPFLRYQDVACFMRLGAFSFGQFLRQVCERQLGGEVLSLKSMGLSVLFARAVGRIRITGGVTRAIERLKHADDCRRFAIGRVRIASEYLAVPRGQRAAGIENCRTGKCSAAAKQVECTAQIPCFLQLLQQIADFSQTQHVVNAGDPFDAAAYSS